MLAFLVLGFIISTLISCIRNLEFSDSMGLFGSIWRQKVSLLLDCLTSATMTLSTPSCCLHMLVCRDFLNLCSSITSSNKAASLCKPCSVCHKQSVLPVHEHRSSSISRECSRLCILELLALTPNFAVHQQVIQNAAKCLS